MSKEIKALVTAGGPNMFPILKDFSVPTFNEYAQAQGYDVSVHSIVEDEEARKGQKAKQARWQKIAIIRDSLKKHDLVAWFDADVMICRTDEDIADNLSDDDFQAFTMHSVPTERRINPNTGVWVIRNCEESFDFLDEVEEIGIPAGRWSDQGAVMKALGWEMGDERYNGARPGKGTKFLPGTAWLPTGWNQPYKGEGRSDGDNYVGRPVIENPNAIHFMGMTIDERKLVMGSFLSGTTQKPIERTINGGVLLEDQRLTASA